MRRSVEKRLIVVPMKDPSFAKTRLASALSVKDRVDLAGQLFDQTLKALCALPTHPDLACNVATVTGSSVIAAKAKAARVAVIPEGQQHGLNMALHVASAWAVEHGYDSLCLIPADIAAPDKSDLAQFVHFPLQAGEVVLCPSSDLGTNAMLLPLPVPFRYAYGTRSFLAHYNAAERAGLRPIVAPFPSLKLDIDTQDDLALLDDTRRDPV